MGSAPRESVVEVHGIRRGIYKDTGGVTQDQKIGSGAVSKGFGPRPVSFCGAAPNCSFAKILLRTAEVPTPPFSTPTRDLIWMSQTKEKEIITRGLSEK